MRVKRPLFTLYNVKIARADAFWLASVYPFARPFRPFPLDVAVVRRPKRELCGFRCRSIWMGEGKLERTPPRSGRFRCLLPEKAL